MRFPRLCSAALLLAVLASSTASAQVAVGIGATRHVYHPDLGYIPYGGGGLYGGAGGLGGLAAGEGVRAAGLGQAAAGLGDLRTSTAQAQSLHQQAVTQYLNNAALLKKTELETSEEQQAYTKQQIAAGIEAGKQQVALYQKTLENMAAPHRLTSDQVDSTGTVLHWPFCLRGQPFAELRERIDHLYDARTPDNSGPDSESAHDIEQACDQMNEVVKEQVRAGMSATDFVTAKHFISSISYEAGFKVKPKS